MKQTQPIRPDIVGVDSSSLESGLKNPKAVPPKDVFPSTPRPAPQLIKSSAASEILKQTLFSLGLSQDGLNKALFIFTRFFSLPPGTPSDPAAILTQLRRTVLESQDNAGDEALIEKKALAAAALFDKGVKFTRESLDIYSGTGGISIDPDSEQSDGRGQSGSYSGTPDQKKEKNENREKAPESDELKASFSEFSDTNRLQNDGDLQRKILNFANRLPGKNGQKWIVWPFDLTFEGNEIKVLVRFLLNEYNSGKLIADVAGKTNSWQFIFDKKDQAFKADIAVFPEKRPFSLKILENDAKKVLSPLGITEISVKNGKKDFSLLHFLENENIVSIKGEI